MLSKLKAKEYQTSPKNEPFVWLDIATGVVKEMNFD